MISQLETKGFTVKTASFITFGLAAVMAIPTTSLAQDEPDLIFGSKSNWSKKTALEVSRPVAKVAAIGAAPTTFAVSRDDRTIRETLARWSKSVSWVNEPEHWTVPYDLPVLSAADLGPDFKGAVRSLLSSTDLTNMPLQPCFYSNQVLRIVPKAELCDRASN